MPKNHFKDNRLSLQKSFIRKKLLIPLTQGHLPILIEERNNNNRPNTLKTVRINNIPVAEDIAISYVLDVELTGEIFSAAPKISTVEKVIFVLTRKSLYIVLVEMKSSLTPNVIRDLKKKIEDTIGRTVLFLTHYLLDNEQFDNCDIKFATLVFYNNDYLTEEIIKKSDRTLENDDLTKIFQKELIDCIVEEPLGQQFRVRVFFEKNPIGSEEFEFDFSTLFARSPDLANAIIDIRTLP